MGREKHRSSNFSYSFTMILHLFWELFDQHPTADASGHLLPNNHQTFGKAIRWIEKKFGYNLLRPERRKHSNSLRGYGWRGSVWGIRRRVILTHRQKINEYLSSLNLYRSNSVKVAFRNRASDHNARLAEQALNFVSSAVAHKQSSKKRVFQPSAE